MSRDEYIYVRAPGNMINVNSANMYGVCYPVPREIAKTLGLVGEVGEAAKSPAFVPQTLADLAIVVRRDFPKQSAAARLLDLMHGNIQVSFDQLQDDVHKAKVDDDAIEKLIKAVRKYIKDSHLPFELVICDRYLLRREIQK